RKVLIEIPSARSVLIPKRAMPSRSASLPNDCNWATISELFILDLHCNHTTSSRLYRRSRSDGGTDGEFPLAQRGKHEEEIWQVQCSHLFHSTGLVGFMSQKRGKQHVF